MSSAALKFIDDKLTELNIDYEFGGWTSSPVPNPFWVGEYTEPDSLTVGEDRQQEITFILTGTGTTWLKLEQDKETIENNISQTAILPNGNGIAVSYSGALIIPTGDATLKRTQINLTIREWRI